MTDPLGRSQVVPYLKGLSAEGHKIRILSAEKPERLAQYGAEIREYLKSCQIEWSPMVYHKKPPMLSTVWDVQRMSRRAFELARTERIEAVHCRSYVPSLVGLHLKRRLGIRFIFDMRGFWADERVDGGLWNLSRPHYQLAYKFFKRRERQFLEESDRAVSLTQAGKAEMGRWGLSSQALERIEVIPCCADLEHFRRDRVAESARTEFRTRLSLSEKDLVVSYLGSVGTWYLLDEMMGFFKQLMKKLENAKFLFVTPDDPSIIRAAAERAQVPESALRILEASRSEVPVLLSLSQLGLFFIKPSYSKISSSPTKLAEYLAMGIPVITNSGVGDSEWISERYKIGEVVKNFTPQGFAPAIERVPDLLRMSAEEIRGVAQSYFSLSKGVEAYQRIYTSL